MPILVSIRSRSAASAASSPKNAGRNNSRRSSASSPARYRISPAGRKALEQQLARQRQRQPEGRRQDERVSLRLRAFQAREVGHQIVELRLRQRVLETRHHAPPRQLFELRQLQFLERMKFSAGILQLDRKRIFVNAR